MNVRPPRTVNTQWGAEVGTLRAGGVPFLAHWLRVGMIVLLGLGCVRQVGGAEPARPQPRIRRIMVPADQPQKWPAGEWLPLPLAEFEQRWGARGGSVAEPASAVIRQAEYAAILNQDELQGGECEWRIQRFVPAAVALSLAPCNLPLRGLAWKEGSAVWGISATGGLQLVVDRAAGTVRGAWRLNGQAIPGGRKFSLELPPATTSRLSLKIPAGRTLSSTLGVVQGPQSAGEPGWNMWTVDLGQHNRTLLVVSAAGQQLATQPLMVARREIAYAIRQEVAKLQIDFNLDVWEAPVRELKCVAAPELKIISISLGDHSNLSWDERPSPTGRLLRIPLPNAVEGGGILLRIQALVEPTIDQSWALPQIRLVDAVPVDGQVSFNVLPPLELADFQIDGYRQTSLVTTPSDGETIVLRQLQPEGEAKIFLAWPRFDAQCRMLTQVRAIGPEWSATTYFEWTVTSGSAFSARCELPPDWEVTDVRDADPSGAETVISWELLRRPGQPVILRAEFRDALAPDRPRRMRVTARLLAPPLGRLVPVPFYKPWAAATAEHFVSIVTENTVSPALQEGNGVAIATPSEYSSAISGSEGTGNAPGNGTAPLLLKSRAVRPSGQFLLQSARDLADVQVEVQGDVGRRTLAESFQMRIVPRNAALKRVLVYLSETGESPVWSLAAEPGRPLEARRLESLVHAAWNVPEEGELWEVRLPEPQGGEFTLLGRRTRTLKSPDHVALVFVPHANSFQGRLVLNWAKGVSVQATPRNLDADVPPSDGAGKTERLAWRYREPTGELSVQVAQTIESVPPLTISALEVTARFPLEDREPDLYRTVIRLSQFSESEPFRWSLPPSAALLYVLRDGQRVVPERRQEQWEVQLSNRPAVHAVEVVYTVPARVGSGPHHHRLNLLRVRQPVLRFDLSLQIPDLWQVDPQASTLPCTQPLPMRTSWRTLLFGPFGRPAFESFYNPLTLFERGTGDAHASREEEMLPDAEPEGRTPHIEQRAGLRTGEHSGGRSLLAGPGWRTLRYAAPQPPAADLELVFWNRLLIWQVALSLLAGTVLGGIFVRRNLSRSLQAWSLWSIPLTACLSISIPGLYAEFAGSVFLGVVVVSLLPQGWLERYRLAGLDEASRVPSGSTRSFARLAVGLLALVAWSVGETWAVDRPAEPPAAAGKGTAPLGNGSLVAGTSPPVVPEVWDVLIPVGPEGKPAGKLPVAYLPPLLHRLLTPVDKSLPNLPEYLLTAASYQGQVRDGEAFRIRARYELFVLSPNSEVRVELPLQDVHLGGDDACLVDGKPVPVFPGTDGRGCALKLAGIQNAATPPVALPAAVGSAAGVEPQTADSTARGGLPFRRYDIEFQLRPEVQARGELSTTQCGVPAVPIAQVELLSDKPLRFAAVGGGEQSLATLLPGAVNLSWQSFAVGPVSRLHWHWSGTGMPLQPAVELRWKTSCIVDVDPMLLQFHCQATARVVQGACSTLRWRLPLGATLRSVQAPDLLQQQLLSTAGGGRDLWLTFSRPQTGDISLQLTLLLPVQSVQGVLGIPGLPLPECGDGGPQASRTESRQIALRPPADLKLEILSEDLKLLQPRSSAEFQKEQAVDGSRPFTAYAVEGATGIQVRLAVLRPQTDVHSTSLYRYGREQVQLSYVARIDTRSAPGFRYRLRVDPRLQITSISVVEDGAERMLRWNSAPGGQALVFLNDRTTREQVLRLQAQMPLTVPSRTALPYVRLTYGHQHDDRISIFHDSDLNVQLVDTARLTQLPDDPAEQFPSGRELSRGRFLLPAGEAPLVVDVRKNVAEIKADRLFILNTQEKQWKLTAKLLLSVQRGRGSEFQVVVPREWVPISEVNCDAPGSIVSLLQPDGSLKLTISPESPVQTSTVVTLKVPVSARSGLSLTLPDIRVLEAVQGTTLVLTQNRGSTAQLQDRAFIRLNPQGLSAELRNLIPEPPPGTEWMSAVPTSLPVRLQFPLPVSSTAGVRRVILQETLLALSPDISEGRQVLWLPPGSPEHLEIEWPAELTPIAVLVDGSLVPATRTPSDLLTIPLHSGPASQTVLIAWQEHRFHSGFWGSELTLRIPRPHNATVESDVTEIIPPVGFRLRPAHDQTPRQPWELALDRWGAWLRWQDAQLNPEAGDDVVYAADQLIRQGAADAERLARRAVRAPGNPISPEGLAQLEELRARTADFLPDRLSVEGTRGMETAPFSESSPALMIAWQGSHLPPGTCRLSDLAGNPVLLQSAPRRAWQWVLGPVAAAGLWWIVRRARRSGWGTTVQASPWLATMILGLLWWICLRESACGLMCACGGLGAGVYQVIRSRWPAQPVENSVLSHSGS